eukprot:1343798-Pleurochrysis_carterae.AAC.2
MEWFLINAMWCATCGFTLYILSRAYERYMYVRSLEVVASNMERVAHAAVVVLRSLEVPTQTLPFGHFRPPDHQARHQAAAAVQTRAHSSAASAAPKARARGAGDLVHGAGVPRGMRTPRGSRDQGTGRARAGHREALHPRRRSDARPRQAVHAAHGAPRGSRASAPMVHGHVHLRQAPPDLALYMRSPGVSHRNRIVKLPTGRCPHPLPLARLVCSPPLFFFLGFVAEAHVVRSHTSPFWGTCLENPQA